MRKILLLLTSLLLGSAGALAQSNPGLKFGDIPTQGQWNNYFSNKFDFVTNAPANSVPYYTGTTTAVGNLSGDCTMVAWVMTCTKTGGVTLGTAATANTGTTGATVPLNNGGFTQSGTVNFTSTVQIGGITMTFPASGLIAGTSDSQTFTNKTYSNPTFASIPAVTILGNATSSTATGQGFTIPGLTAKPTPDANNDQLLLYDNSTGSYKKATPAAVTSATALDNLSPGTLMPYAGLTVPNGNWQFANGQALNRVTFANLFNATTVQTTGNTHTSSTIDGMGTTTNMKVGMFISGSGIQAGTTIASIVSGTSITLSLATTSTVTSAAIVVSPYGIGDGSTTFNVPDLRGRFWAGADAMGGSAAGRLGSGITGGITGAATVGATGGEQQHTLSVGEMPAHNHPVVGSPITSTTAGGTFATGGGGVPPLGVDGLTTSNTGGGGAHNNTPPTIVGNWIIHIRALRPANDNRADYAIAI